MQRLADGSSMQRLVAAHLLLRGVILDSLKAHGDVMCVNLVPELHPLGYIYIPFRLHPSSSCASATPLRLHLHPLLGCIP